jgi:hypothetical protein
LREREYIRAAQVRPGGLALYQSRRLGGNARSSNGGHQNVAAFVVNLIYADRLVTAKGSRRAERAGFLVVMVNYALIPTIFDASLRGGFLLLFVLSLGALLGECALALAVQCEKIAKVFSEIPECIDSDINVEVCLVRMCNGNL